MCGVGGINLEKRKIFIEDLIKKRFRYIKKKKTLNWGLFYALRLGNCIHCTFIFTFLYTFLRAFLFCFVFCFLHTVI